MAQLGTEFRLMRVQGVIVQIDNLTLTGGCADGTGSARNGGAIYLDQGSLTLIQASVRSNRAHSGGGIYSINSAGTVIYFSTLSANSATLGGALNVDGQTDLFNSTVSSNSTSSQGAGAYLRTGATLNLDFVTVDGSSSALPNEIHAVGATVSIKNSILRNARCSAEASPPSTWNASGNNLDSGSICGNLFGSNFATGATLNLGALADNGGPTQTRAVLAGSQAIDAAFDCTTQAGLIIGASAPVGFDQRGENRPQSAACDIGAFESALSQPPQTIFVDEVASVGVVAIQADGLCSLREALDNANGGGLNHADCTAGGGADTVVLPAGAVFTLSDASFIGPIGPVGLPLIAFQLTISGQGATVQRNTATNCVLNNVAESGELRLLLIGEGASLTIEDLTLANGCADGPIPGGSGGAIRHDGEQLILRRSTIRDSRAILGGGITMVGLTALIEASTLSGNSAVDGGALALSGGSTTLSNSTLSGNSASSEGGAAFLANATLNLEHATMSANTASVGGGIAASFLFAGVINARNSILQASTCADPLPGGVPFFDWNASGANLDSGSSCASLFSSNFTANASTNLAALAHNGGGTRTHALLAGSQALNTASNCTAIGGGAIASDQRGVPRPQNGVCDIGAFEAHSIAAGTINVDAVAGVGVVPLLADGLCSLREGIENANANSASFLNPDCEPGNVSGLDQVALAPGALYTLTNAAATAPFGRTGLPPIGTLITIVGNGATIESGNACTFNGTQAAGEFRLLLVLAGNLGTQNLTLANGCADGGAGARDGGAVYVDQGGLIAQNTTLRNNRARSGGAVFSTSNVLLESSTLAANTATFGGALHSNDTATLSNVTVSGNSAVSLGGALYLDTGATFNLEQVSFSANTSGQNDGIYASSATLNLKNSILNNTRCAENTDAAASTWNASGNSLDNGSTCASKFGATVAANSTLLLGVLASNGGATQTHALLPGSPAIDAAVNCTRLGGSAVTIDQRGISRPRGTFCDIGAFESRGFTLTASAGSGQTTIVGTAFANPLVVGVSSAFGEPVNGGQVSFAAPAPGASLSQTLSLATIAAGQASLAATANAVVGNYVVSASARGGAAAANFNLGNVPVPAENIFANGFE